MGMGSTSKKRLAGLLFSGGMLLQLGSCDFGSFAATTTTTTTIDAREVIIQLVRGAIITPLDAYVTNAVSNLLSNE